MKNEYIISKKDKKILIYNETDDQYQFYSAIADRLVILTDEEFVEAWSKNLIVNHDMREKTKDDKWIVKIKNTNCKEEKIKPGIYILQEEYPGTVLKPIQSRNNSFISIRPEIEKQVEDIYYTWKKNLNKDSILFFGPPGSGKTYIIENIMKQIIKEEGLVIFIDSSIDFKSLIEMRDALKDYKKLLVIEELTEFSDSINTEPNDKLLTFLDGELSWDNSLIFMSTNFPEKLPENIVDRPSRVGHFIFIENPNEDEITRLIKNKGLKENETLVKECVKNQFSVDMICRIMDNMILGKTFEETIEYMKSRRKFVKTHFKPNKQKLGI